MQVAISFDGERHRPKGRVKNRKFGVPVELSASDATVVLPRVRTRSPQPRAEPTMVRPSSREACVRLERIRTEASKWPLPLPSELTLAETARRVNDAFVEDDPTEFENTVQGRPLRTKPRPHTSHRPADRPPWRGPGPFAPEQEAGRALAKLRRMQSREGLVAGAAVTSPIVARVPSLGRVDPQEVTGAPSPEEIEARWHFRLQRQTLLQRTPMGTARSGQTPMTPMGTARLGQTRTTSMMGMSIRTATSHDAHGPRAQSSQGTLRHPAIDALEDSEVAELESPAHVRLLRRLERLEARKTDSSTRAPAGEASEGGRTGLLALEQRRNDREVATRTVQSVDWIAEMFSDKYPDWLRGHPRFQELNSTRPESVSNVVRSLRRAVSDGDMLSGDRLFFTLKDMIQQEPAAPHLEELLEDALRIPRRTEGAGVEGDGLPREVIHTLKVVPRTSREVYEICRVLLTSSMFRSLQKSELHHIAEQATLVHVGQHEALFEAGEAQAAYCVLFGTVLVEIKDIGTRTLVRSGVWLPGRRLESQGAAVTAFNGDTWLMMVPRGDFEHVVGRAEERKALKYMRFLQEQPGFKCWSRSKLTRWLAACLEVHVAEGEVVANQGDKNDRLYMLLEGTMELWHTAEVRHRNAWPAGPVEHEREDPTLSSSLQVRVAECPTSHRAERHTVSYTTVRVAELRSGAIYGAGWLEETHPFTVKATSSCKVLVMGSLVFTAVPVPEIEAGEINAGEEDRDDDARDMVMNRVQVFPPASVERAIAEMVRHKDDEEADSDACRQLHEALGRVVSVSNGRVSQMLTRGLLAFEHVRSYRRVFGSTAERGESHAGPKIPQPQLRRSMRTKSERMMLYSE
jgi:CRP-like cAMP-binding protein